MSQLKHILFPVDFSEPCRIFAPVVRTVACRAGARVTMLNTLELPSGYYSNPYAILTFTDILQSMRHERADFLNFLRDDFASLPPVSRISKHGDIAQTIVDYARHRDVDLIMLPTHGVGLFRRLLLGSVTAKVLHDAECPIWTSAHSTEISHAERLRKVLCAVNLRDESVDVMRYAAWLARMYGTQLRFINVLAVGESWTVRSFEAQFVARMELEARAQMAEVQARAGTPGDATVRSGEIARCVRREAMEWEADLIVIGRGVIGEPFGRLRTETYNIIRESSCSVVSV